MFFVRKNRSPWLVGMDRQACEEYFSLFFKLQVVEFVDNLNSQLDISKYTWEMSECWPGCPVCIWVLNCVRVH